MSDEYNLAAAQARIKELEAERERLHAMIEWRTDMLRNAGYVEFHETDMELEPVLDQLKALRARVASLHGDSTIQVATIRDLRAEVERLKKERDEAREEVERLKAHDGNQPSDVCGIIKAHLIQHEYDGLGRRYIVAERPETKET